jgi:hypothetical protein
MYVKGTILYHGGGVGGFGDGGLGGLGDQY